MRLRSLALLHVALLCLATACDPTGPTPPDAPLADAPPEPTCEGPPGLYADGSCEVLAEGVRRFTPRYALWSDGAVKERFVYLPPGATIDTTDPDGWIYPVGTIFWKTFSRDGLRIETRINEKLMEGTGPGAWRMRTFAWSADQRSVTEVTTGVVDALGTGHDIPPVSLCARCHDGMPTDVSLGFTAIQLGDPTSELSLSTLVAEGRLSTPIAEDAARIPGTDVERAALGYLHANCGACHGGTSAPMGLRFWVNVGIDDVTMTDTWTTAVGADAAWIGASTRIAPGDPDASAVVLRMSTRAPFDQMPPIATELVDDTGIAAVRAWIESIP